ncbi:MAG: DNA-deoxyinosine glycosylase [Eubacteriales bacterium]|nr:DNA-deoxyinosine glycosylase [Eubacteriales bacterium]
MAQDYQHVMHTFEPVFDENSRILILGTFPSVKSRENNFYYGHPQNRFWQVLAGLTGESVPDTIPEKKIFLLKNHIAIWDVIVECDIAGSSDSSIKNVVPADLSRVLQKAPVKQIFANGNKACELYRKYAMPKVGREIVKLPSTSPANAAFTLDRLMEQWSKITYYLQEN